MYTLKRAMCLMRKVQRSNDEGRQCQIEPNFFFTRSPRVSFSLSIYLTLKMHTCTENWYWKICTIYRSIDRSTYTLTFAAVITTEARIALAMTQALSIAWASIWTILCHVIGNSCIKCNLLFVTIIIIQWDKPMARLHISRHFSAHRRLLMKRKWNRKKFE